VNCFICAAPSGWVSPFANMSGESLCQSENSVKPQPRPEQVHLLSRDGPRSRRSVPELRPSLRSRSRNSPHYRSALLSANPLMWAKPRKIPVLEHYAEEAVPVYRHPLRSLRW
jgi:hypothetical protein